MLQLLRCCGRLTPALIVGLLATVLAMPASAATVPLNGRTFDAACKAANAGDVVTVPAGTYSGQSISCTKSVTLLAQGAVTLPSLSFSGANGPTVDGVHVTGSYASGAVAVIKSSNITIRDTTINNMTYVEGGVDVLFDHDTWEPLDSTTKWNNGDMVDIYEQAATAQPNTRITIQDSVLHGLRAPTTTSHSDAIQFCNCAGNDTQHAIGIKILRNKFYDNECMNVRANPNTEITLENNLFGDTYSGISGCGYYALDVFYAQATVRYNTFPGSQEAQVSTSASADYGQTQSWVGNVGAGMSSACGAIRGTYAYNVWTEQKCGTTDKKVTSLKLNSDGSPQAGSPVIDAGNPSSYPAQDFNGNDRFAGAAPDAGAIEYGASSGGGTTPPPADTTPPDTTITTAPSSGTATTASVTFTASESGSTFECRLDGGAWATCVSPKTYSGLAVGSHTIDVRATDAAGNVDASPASATWTVSSPPPTDTTPPVTTITAAPSSGTATTASVTFTSNESGSTFQCKLDSGSWSSCTSPKTYNSVGVGSHSVSVRAIDAAGNVDPTPATASWTVSAPPPVDTTAPTVTITSAPSSGATATSASLAFSGSDDVTPAGSLNYQCKLDAGSYAACSSPKAYNGLAAGSHTFSVRATDGAGNTSSAATATWTIATPDTVAPTVAFTSRPSAVSPSLSTSATLAFAGTDDRTAAGAITYLCTLDGGPEAACDSPDTVDELGLGTHTFTVKAVDAAGNQSAPASATWLVVALTLPGLQDAPPTTTVATPPDTTTTATALTPAPAPAPPVATAPVVTSPAPAPALVAPTVTLLKPAAGTRFTTSLKASAAASDDGKVDHVEFWLDGKRFAYDTAAPYSGSMNTKSVTVGDHTLAVRAVDDQGLTASVGTSVQRVAKSASGAAAGARVQVSGAAGDDATALLANGPKSGIVAVGLANCADRKAKIAKIMTIKLGKSGRSGTNLPTGDLCVAEVTLRD